MRFNFSVATWSWIDVCFDAWSCAPNCAWSFAYYSPVPIPSHYSAVVFDSMRNSSNCSGLYFLKNFEILFAIVLLFSTLQLAHLPRIGPKFAIKLNESGELDKPCGWRFKKKQPSRPTELNAHEMGYSFAQSHVCYKK